MSEENATCKDCGIETKPGPGSARCPSCWEDRCETLGKDREELWNCFQEYDEDEA